MSLYAIGDLHLHFQSELKIGHPQLKDKAWKNHEEKLQKNCAKLLTDDDTLVLLGDHSWGKNLDACAADLQYIIDLPGRKILIRGNHDMFWDAKKTAALNERYAGRLEFLQNNYYTYREYALVGTKGFSFEGPFYLDRRGRIVGWDEKNEEHAKKIVARELERLRVSFEAAKAAGCRKFILFLHYPPTSILEDESCFTRIAEEYRAEQSSTPTATARAAFTTACWVRRTVCFTAWFRATSSNGSRSRYWIRERMDESHQRL